jgi:hypothetical protein
MSNFETLRPLGSKVSWLLIGSSKRCCESVREQQPLPRRGKMNAAYSTLAAWLARMVMRAQRSERASRASARANEAGNVHIICLRSSSQAEVGRRASNASRLTAEAGKVHRARRLAPSGVAQLRRTAPGPPIYPGWGKYPSS